MDLLITGGTGCLGQEIARQALARGDRVRLLGRNFASVQPLLAAGATAHPADLRDPDAVQQAVAGADAVIHAGALSAPWGPRQEFFSSNVAGTANVIAACLGHQVSRLVAISSPSVTFSGGPVLGQTEAAPRPRRFTSVYAETKALGEDLVNAAAQVGLATVILRPKAIFGPGDQALLPRLLDAARRGRLVQIGNGQNEVDLTYVGNVAHAALLAVTVPAAVGKTYFITNDEHPHLWEVIRRVLRDLGLSADLRRMSLPAALAAASLLELRARLTKREPLLTRYSVQILAQPQTYDISAARRDLGYTPLVNLDEGIRQTVAALRATGAYG